ncbi:hypothetical protein K438DRAFT_1776726 [Mycena galopus ATCC 62051]|nr:hypothetical protein K438DRAFT_1776726 [Mycena galopus ATCC 62051]
MSLNGAALHPRNRELAVTSETKGINYKLASWVKLHPTDSGTLNRAPEFETVHDNVGAAKSARRRPEDPFSFASTKVRRPYRECAATYQARAAGIPSDAEETPRMYKGVELCLCFPPFLCPVRSWERCQAGIETTRASLESMGPSASEPTTMLEPKSGKRQGSEPERSREEYFDEAGPELQKERVKRGSFGESGSLLLCLFNVAPSIPGWTRKESRVSAARRYTVLTKERKTHLIRA